VIVNGDCADFDEFTKIFLTGRYLVRVMSNPAMPIRTKEETDAILMAAKVVVESAGNANVERFGVTGSQAILHAVAAVIAATGTAHSQDQARDMIVEIFEMVNRLRGVTQR
jgi:hypothetical protein